MKRGKRGERGKVRGRGGRDRKGEKKGGEERGGKGRRRRGKDKRGEKKPQTNRGKKKQGCKLKKKGEEKKATCPSLWLGTGRGIPATAEPGERSSSASSPGSTPGAWESARGSRLRSPGALGMSAAGAGPVQGVFNQKHQVNTYFQHDWRRLQMGSQAPLPRELQDRAASALDNCPVCLLLLCWSWDSVLDTGVGSP